MTSLLYLFQSIPKILFEPLAIVSLLWIVLALFFFRKLDKALFRLVFASVAFMLAWRLCSRMLSARYASFLIYPAVIFTACFCLRIGTFLRWLFRRLKWGSPQMHLLCGILPAAVIFGLAAACAGKSLHRNLAGNFLSDVVRTYLKHSGGKGFIHAQENVRVSWYVGRRFWEVDFLYVPQGEAAFSSVRKAVGRIRNTPGNHYFFYYLKKGEQAPGPETMKKELAGGEWRILDRRWVSSRKNKELVLALCVPACARLEEWTGKIPDLPKNNLLRNGDFEAPLAGAALKHRREYYKKTGFLSYADSSRTLPAHWGLRLGADRKNPPDLRLTGKDVLAGVSSLAADARRSKHHFALLSSPVRKKNTDLRFSFFVRNDDESDSRVSVRFIAWLKDRRRDHFVKDLALRLGKGKTYRVHGTIKKEQIPASAADGFYIYVCAKGKYTFDQFCVTAEPENQAVPKDGKEGAADAGAVPR